MLISYNWLKAYLPDIPEPKHLEKLFTYHICEVESVTPIKSDGSPVESDSSHGVYDWVFDLGVLPNRAHDLLSHQGVAQELSGLLGIPFKDPTSQYKTPATVETNLKIENQTENCRRYSARIVRNVKVGPSPEWMVEHLASIGQRSINNIVDATNIVMYDCGQPNHAYDLAILKGEKIVISNAKDGEELPVVGKEGIIAKLNSEDTIISDGEKTLGLAGVKGGLLSGISETTTDIVLEVANFNPTAVRKTARRLGLLSDSAKRFENDLSASLCDFGMFALSALLIELFPDAVFEDIVDVYPVKEEKRTLSFSRKHIQKMLGIEIKDTEIEKILRNYNYHYQKEGDVYMLEVPPLRLDLAAPHDMAEEIGRVCGYDKVIPQLPDLDFIPAKNEMYEKIIQARDALVRDGYKEVMTYAFANTGSIEVLASASDKKFLRTNLSDGLKKSYELNKLNAPLLNANETKIFEIGTVFENGKENIHVGYANKKEVKEMTLEKFLESASSSADISGLRVESPDQKISAEDFAEQPQKSFEMWSVYPFITRDIAVWVPEGTQSETLSDTYTEFGTEILRGQPFLFDQFTKEGRTSYGFRLIFQAYDRTLTDDEINLIMSHITEKISSLGFEAR